MDCFTTVNAVYIIPDHYDPLTRIAGLVLAELPPPAEEEQGGVKQFDLMTVILILKVALMVFQCLTAVTPKSLRKVNSPGILARWRFRRLVKKVLEQQGSPERADELCDAILVVASRVDGDQLRGAIAQAQADPTLYATAASYELV